MTLGCVCTWPWYRVFRFPLCFSFAKDLRGALDPFDMFFDVIIGILSFNGLEGFGILWTNVIIQISKCT